MAAPACPGGHYRGHHGQPVPERLPVSTAPADAVAAAGLTVTQVSLAELHQDPDNARTHSPKNIAAIKASLARFGQRLPLVVREGQLVAGNGTAQAMAELGWQHALVTYADDLTHHEAIALAVALNRSGELAGWDAALLLDLLDAQPTLDGTGFDHDDLDDLRAQLDRLPVLEPAPFLGGYGETPEDEAARAARRAGNVPRVAQGLREVVLVYTAAEYDALHQALGQLSGQHGTSGTAATVLAVVLAAAGEAGP